MQLAAAASAQAKMAGKATFPRHLSKVEFIYNKRAARLNRILKLATSFPDVAGSSPTVHRLP